MSAIKTVKMDVFGVFEIEKGLPDRFVYAGGYWTAPNAKELQGFLWDNGVPRTDRYIRKVEISWEVLDDKK